MFKIYLYNWAKNFNVETEKYTLVSDETEVLSIPVDSPDKIWLLAPSIKAEVNKAESFDFTVMPGTEYYNAFIRLKTWIRVTYDDATIFWGLVKTINNSSSLHKRSIHAEGAYTTLSDSPVPGKEEDLQDSLTARAYLDFLVDNHNKYIEESFKKFSIGKIAADLDTRSKKRKPTSWTDTLSELNNLMDEHGGYVRARYNDSWKTNGKNRTYLDWAKYYFRDLGDGKRPTIKLLKNLIDISKGIGNNEIFTRLIPVGHKSTESTTTSSSSSKSQKESSFVYISSSKEYIKIKDVPGMISSDVSKQKKELEADGFRKLSDFTDAEKNYGVIYLTENFSNASNATDLKNYALEWIKHNYYGIVPSFSVKAIDMHMLGEKDPQILVGDVIDVAYPEYDNDGTAHTVTRKLICKAIQYNLLNPEANTYTVGVPCDATDFEYGTKSKASKKSTSKSSASSAASNRKPGGGGNGGNITITWGMVLNWLRLYYDVRSDANVVDWTETRWTTYKPKLNSDDPERRLLYVNDPMPYNTFYANKELVTILTVQNGQNDKGEPIYEEQRTYTYAKFKRPDSDDVVRGRVLGHYSIDSSKTKPAQVAQNRGNPEIVSGGSLLSHGVPIDSTKKYGNIYDYGVCATDDGHAYTFNWSDFYIRYRRSMNTEETTFSTYFEIAKTSSASGEINASSIVEASTGTDGENIGPIVWKNHDGKTTAEIANDEGWSSFGYLTDDDGNVRPAIKLNDTITYTDKDGNTVTKSGFVTAEDLNLPEIPSFTTKIAVIDNAIIDRATIMELRAAVAELGGDEAYGEDSYEKDEHGNLIKTEDGKWKLREGTKFVTNSRNMVAASGVYGVREVIDPLTGKPTTELYIKDGAGFKIQKATKDNPGHKSYFGVWDEDNLTGGIMAEKINGESNVYINGNHINIGNDKTKRILTEATDELGQVVGQYVWNYDSKGRKTTIKGLDGSGSHIWKDGAAYGLWHEGNLTAGVMVEKLNSGETKTHIKGDRIAIGNRGTKSVSLTDAITINEQGYLTTKSGMWVQGNLNVTKTNGSGGTLQASNIEVGLGGELRFTDRAGSVVINRTIANNLTRTDVNHVKITTDTATGTKTLWYLPAGATDSAENWKECGNFNSATSNVVVSWQSGGAVGSAAYMVVKSTTGKELYKANFGGETAGYNKYFKLEVNNNEATTLAGQMSIAANIHLKYGTLNSSYEFSGSTFYSRRLIINAAPVWDNGYDSGYQAASENVKTTYPSANKNQICFTYPTANVVGGSIRKSKSSDLYTVRYDNDYVYLTLTTTNSQTDKIKLYHNKYSEGRNYERSIVYTRFAHNSTDNYYIESYENASNPHSAVLSDGKLKYQLGQSTNNVRVIQIQDTSSTRISNTPTFSFPADRIEVLSKDTNKTDGTALYTLSPVYGGNSKPPENILNSISQVRILRGSVNDDGVRTLTLRIRGPKSDGTGSINIDTVKLEINDYKNGYDDGVFVGRRQMLDEGYEKYYHEASFTCYNITDLGIAGKRYYFYCDSYSAICSQDDDLYVHW